MSRGAPGLGRLPSRPQSVLTKAAPMPPPLPRPPPHMHAAGQLHLATAWPLSVYPPHAHVGGEAPSPVLLPPLHPRAAMELECSRS